MRRTVFIPSKKSGNSRGFSPFLRYDGAGGKRSLNRIEQRADFEVMNAENQGFTQKGRRQASFFALSLCIFREPAVLRRRTGWVAHCVRETGFLLHMLN